MRRLNLLLAGVVLCATVSVRIEGQPESGPPLPADMAVGQLIDPFLGMPAYSVRYPKGWHMQGGVDQGNVCYGVPSPVFRITSADGLSVFERMPPVAWTWGTAPGFRPNKSACLPLEDTISGKEFLKLFASMLKVEYVGEEPIPDDVLQAIRQNAEASWNFWQNKYRYAGMRPPEYYGDAAWARVRLQNGSYTMRGRITVVMDCNRHGAGTLMQPGRWQAECNARVRYFYAPEDKFAFLADHDAAIFAAELPAWTRQWNAMYQRLVAAEQQQLDAMNKAYEAQRDVQQTEFNRQQQVQQIEHEQVLATMQRGTDLSMQRSAELQQREHTITADWVDGILGQQTVRDPGTGQIGKVPSGANYVWHNSVTNQSFLTSDPNSNPNGVLDGSWTQTLRVHGDGSR